LKNSGLFNDKYIKNAKDKVPKLLISDKPKLKVKIQYTISRIENTAKNRANLFTNLANLVESDI
jgi:hypothetical protein